MGSRLWVRTRIWLHTIDPHCAQLGKSTPMWCKTTGAVVTAHPITCVQARGERPRRWTAAVCHLSWICGSRSLLCCPEKQCHACHEKVQLWLLQGITFADRPLAHPQQMLGLLAPFPLARPPDYEHAGLSPPVSSPGLAPPSGIREARGRGLPSRLSVS